MKKLVILTCLCALASCGGDSDDQLIEIKTINGRNTVKISGTSVKKVLPKNVAELNISGRKHIICAEKVGYLRFEGSSNSVYAEVTGYDDRGSKNIIEPYAKCPINISQKISISF